MSILTFDATCSIGTAIPFDRWNITIDVNRIGGIEALLRVAFHRL